MKFHIPIGIQILVLALIAWVPLAAAILFWISDLTFADIGNTLTEMFTL
jgi:hypothetical protein